MFKRNNVGQAHKDIKDHGLHCSPNRFPKIRGFIVYHVLAILLLSLFLIIRREPNFSPRREFHTLWEICEESRGFLSLSLKDHPVPL